MIMESENKDSVLIPLQPVCLYFYLFAQNRLYPFRLCLLQKTHTTIYLYIYTIRWLCKSGLSIYAFLFDPQDHFRLMYFSVRPGLNLPTCYLSHLFSVLLSLCLTGSQMIVEINTLFYLLYCLINFPFGFIFQRHSRIYNVPFIVKVILQLT